MGGLPGIGIDEDWVAGLATGLKCPSPVVFIGSAAGKLPLLTPAVALDVFLAGDFVAPAFTPLPPAALVIASKSLPPQ